MKKQVIAAVLTLAMIITLGSIPAYASSANSDTITRLESEIEDLEKKMQVYGNSTAVLGSVYAQTPYYIVYGMTVGETLLSGRYYNVIDEPEDGKVDILGDYVGSHKYLGTITVDINGVSMVCNHFGSMGDEWYTLSDEKAEKQRQLDALLAGPDYLSESGLAAYTFGDMNTIVMQIGNPYIYAYDEYLPIDDNNTAPVIVNGSTLLPIRIIVELSGGAIEWDETTRTATITLGSDVIQLTSGSTAASVNGKTVVMATPAQIINSRLMIPVRFVAENLGMEVSWKSDKKVVVINNASYKSDLLVSRLTLSDGYYTYTDEFIGMAYRYPEEWGTPEILRCGSSKTIYVDQAQFSAGYATVLIDYTLYPSDEELEMVNHPSGNYESVAPTDKNTGIIAISKTTDAYSKNSSCGYVYLLGESGYLVCVFYSLNVMDSGLSETQQTVMDVVHSLSLQEPMG
ncbi:MAG: copper amine oxidase N-terminal domain-containing protein [Clostridiaceae bacterium]|nr:copper amine oxidase N-terminal domain-containing protein [Clostridiaceae bacterium]